MESKTSNSTLSMGDIVDTLQYVKAFHNKTFVIKIGGVTAIESTTLAKDVSLLKSIGVKVVLIHGGGKQITEVLKNYQIESKFLDGIRVTDDETADLVEMVLAGKINKSIVRALNKEGIKDCIGLSGVDNSLLVAEPIDLEKYGRVGRVTKVNRSLLEQMLSSGYLPVIAPFGIDSSSASLNINADAVAASVADALNADKLLFLSDIEGILDENGSLITRLPLDQVSKLIQQGTIHSGMIPKIEACIHAVTIGVDSVHIVNGTKPHSLLRELFTVEGSGTIIEKTKGKGAKNGMD